MSDSTAADKDQATTKRNHLIERIITAAVGAVLLGLQGVNIGETSGNGDLIRRLEQALVNQSAMINEAKAEGSRVDRALENQTRMIDKLDQMVTNEAKMLDLLRQQEQEKKQPN